MKRFLPLVMLAAIVWAGCGGGNKSTTAAGVAITIAPTTASVAGGATQSFTATVTGSTNTAVTWQVNGEKGGDAIIGTVSSTGVYTAPNVLPTTTTIAVTATSQADTTKAATATVTLTAPAVTISISPTSATLAAGATQQFTPTITVTGSSNNAVTWSVNGIVGGNSTVGTVDANGLYTAPASPPKGAITVTATSQANTTFSASVPVTVQFGNASLKGNYVFLATRADNSSGSGFAYRGGEFVADGLGAITSGVSDANSSASGAAPNVPFSGSNTYTIGPDGRGTITFNDASGAHKFSFALTSSTRGQLIEFDSAAVTSGFIRQQDQSAIGGVAGTFVFSLTGDNGGPSAAVGQISFTGGNIAGTEDSNTAGAVSPLTPIVGTFTMGTAGRGTATINTSEFALYLIDASTLTLLDIDPAGARTAGTAYAQASTGFTDASLGSSAFLVSGNAIPGNKPFGEAGRFDVAAGGKFSSGIFDVNNGGAVTNSQFATAATYAVAANGRGTMSNGTSSFIFWMASPQQAVIMESDSAAVAAGLLLQQQAAFHSVTGGYAFAVAGADSSGATPQAIAGQLSTNGFGGLSGTEDVNVGGTVTPGASLSGNLSIGANGRGTGAVQGTVIVNGASTVVSSENYAFYFVSADRFLMLSTSNSSVLSGVAERQCSSGCQF